tara:strand:- start:6508 stop:7314 length:807 start_codon:yes stop_codon:yes gene_type:complete
MNNLKILPLKNFTSETAGEIDLHPLPTIPFNIFVIGRVKAGKSLLWMNLALNENFKYRDLFQVKILISSTAFNDKIVANCLDEFDFVFNEYSEDLLQEIVDMIEKDETDNKYLLILEDIIGNVNFKRNGKIDALTSLITKYRHIGNEKVEGKLSLIIISQEFKYLNVIARQNASAYFLMGSSPSSELKKMSDSLSVFGGSDKKFIELYKESKKVKFDFMYCSIDYLEVWRNFDKLLWSQDDEYTGEPKKEDKDLNIINNTEKLENKKK